MKNSLILSTVFAVLFAVQTGFAETETHFQEGTYTDENGNCIDYKFITWEVEYADGTKCLMGEAFEKPCFADVYVRIYYGPLDQYSGSAPVPTPGSGSLITISSSGSGYVSVQPGHGGLFVPASAPNTARLIPNGSAMLEIHPSFLPSSGGGSLN